MPDLSSIRRRLGKARAIGCEQGLAELLRAVAANLRWRRDRWLARIEMPGLADRHRLPDPSEITLYSEDLSQFPAHQPRRGRPPADRKRVAVSLIATCRDEAANVDAWAERVLAQTRRPDEIVVLDAGSEDGTLAALERLAAASPVPFRVLQHPGVNIARGRNLAIAAARHDRIAATDLGSRPRPDWLEFLVEPFEDGSGTEVVAGWFEPFDRRWRPSFRPCWARLADLDPKSFLPSARSIAFTRAAWQAVGGFPEWLTRTGEDTWFALELKRRARRWAFVPDAVVEWLAPDTLSALARKVHAWSEGDGESGVNAALTRASLGQLLRAPVAGLAALPSLAATLGRQGPRGVSAELERAAWSWTTVAAQVTGYLSGLGRRAEADRRRWSSARGTWLILSGVAIDDTGGGARAAQLAHELLDQGFVVVFVNRYPRNETVDLGIAPRHPNLVTLTFERFEPEVLLAALAPAFEDRPLAALVEFPLAEFLPAIEAVHARGGRVVYDLLDDWESTLGGSWYGADTERSVVARSQVLVATAPALRQRLEQRFGRPVTFVPNAVNRARFDPRRHHQRPVDLPRAGWIAIYAGALWGDWFDWPLLVASARRHPEGAFVLIGDYRSECPEPLPNLHFLGLKPQTVLPAYLAHSDVAIIPWKVTPVTQATSPLKVYEYIAMRKPVVAPDLEPLRGLPGVMLAPDRESFPELVGRVRLTPVDPIAADTFAAANDWSERVARLMAAIGHAG